MIHSPSTSVEWRGTDISHSCTTPSSHITSLGSPCISVEPLGNQCTDQYYCDDSWAIPGPKNSAPLIAQVLLKSVFKSPDFKNKVRWLSHMAHWKEMIMVTPSCRSRILRKMSRCKQRWDIVFDLYCFQTGLILLCDIPICQYRVRISSTDKSSIVQKKLHTETFLIRWLFIYIDSACYVGVI